MLYTGVGRPSLFNAETKEMFVEMLLKSADENKAMDIGDFLTKV